jgi:voltage-gated sodium channel
MKTLANKLVGSKIFENFIIAIILINCVLIGVETYFTNNIILNIQTTCLIIFAIEVVVRMAASKSAKEYFSNSWNVFDLCIVLIGLIPESIFESASTVSAIRVLRVFRVLRLLKASDEIKLIISVLVKSLKTLTYNGIFFSIFIYLFAIIGITLFKLPDINNADASMQYKLTKLAELAPNAPTNSADPYGSLGESCFSLFRLMTGDDWTDIRYNLITASKMEIIDTSETIITTYHVLWFVLAAFLLLNLVVGAIINNYQIIMDNTKKKEDN